MSDVVFEGRNFNNKTKQYSIEHLVEEKNIDLPVIMEKIVRAEAKKQAAKDKITEAIKKSEDNAIVFEYEELPDEFEVYDE